MLEKLKELVAGFVVDHFLSLAVGLLSLALGRWWGKRRAKAEWRRREFMNRLMVSLNSIVRTAEGKERLAIRTLLEKDVADVFLNSTAVEKVLAAAQKTTESSPILPIAKDDRWFILNALLNDIAERFSEGTMAKDLGMPVHTGRYLIALTNEIAGSLRTHKLRAMVVRKDLLLSGAFERSIELESPHHSTRIETLKAMRKMFETEPDHFLEIDITIPS